MRTRALLPRGILAPALAVGVAACAGAGGPGPETASARPGEPAVDPCLVVPAPAPAQADAAAGPAGGPAGAAAITVTVGVPGPVDPAHAPVPRNPAERVVFQQLYETLVRLRCDGRPEPGLAASWRAHDGGRRWSFTLRADARDWDGAPVTAVRVAASWRALREAGTATAPAITSLVVVDAATLEVTLAAPVAAAFFARPELAVAGPAAAGGWPMGSGPFRPRHRGDGGSPDPRGVHTFVSTAGGPAVAFRTVTGDGRNALDAGVDILVTEEPAVIGYAAANPSLATIPLPWDRRYFLLLRGAAQAGGPGDAPATGRDAVEVVVRHAPVPSLSALARDAVPVAARAALDGGAASPCLAPGAGATTSFAAGQAPRARVAYPAGDAVARGLAERLVALALDPGRSDAAWLGEAAPVLQRAGGTLRAAGLDPASFTDALLAGGDAAYVLAAPPGAAAVCADAAALLASAPWLAGGRAAGAAVVPLVETRRTLVIRSSLGGVLVDGNGGLVLGGLVAVPRGRIVPAPGGTAP